MSLLPTTNFVKVISAADSSMAWAEEGGLLKLVHVGQAETFEYVSPCMAGEAEQSLVFRKRANPDLQVRQNKNFDLIVTDNTVDSETFSRDSCYKIESAVACGVQGAVHFKSVNEPARFICSNEGVLKLMEGDPEEDPAFASVSCWVIEEGKSIEEALEEEGDNKAEDEEEEVVLFEPTTNRSLTFASGETQTVGQTFEGGGVATASATEFAAGESTEGSSTHDLGGGSGGYGAGGGNYSSAYSSRLTNEMRDLILNDPGADLTTGSSGGYDFSGKEKAKEEPPKSAVQAPEVKNPNGGMSAVTTAIIVVVVVAALVFLVYMARKHKIMEKVMEYFRKRK